MRARLGDGGIGVLTFGEITEDLVTGELPSPRQRVRETIELAKVADEVGLDVFGIGEHHRTDFVASAPTPIWVGVGGMMDNHQRGRGFAMSRATFEAQATPGSGLLVGSSQGVIDKLMTYHQLYGLTRALVHTAFGGLPQKEHLETRLGTEVASSRRSRCPSRSSPPLRTSTGRCC